MKKEQGDIILIINTDLQYNQPYVFVHLYGTF